MKFQYYVILLVLVFFQQNGLADISIQKNVFGKPLKITASPDSFAGAIYSIKFRGKEYINFTDHGRELQSASSFDDLGECFNPTEAGSSKDGKDLTGSLSVLLNYRTGDSLQTSTNMAFWLLPGQPYGQACGNTQFRKAQNKTVLSGHVLDKTVSIGYQGIQNVISYDVSFKIPEAHQNAGIEAVTGYMPPEFSAFLTYDPLNRVLARLSVQGEQSNPVLFATSDGRHAMGISSLIPQTISRAKGYGSFRFPDTSKWSCVFGEKNGVPAGVIYSYLCFIAIGTVDEVIAAQNALYSTKNKPIPLFRFINGRDHFIVASYKEAASAGYQFEGTAFHVYKSQFDSHMIPIYRCLASYKYHFVSRNQNCEDQTFEGSYGFISATYRKGFTALYRFAHPTTGEHLTTTNYLEGSNNGYKYEGVLGYVPDYSNR